MVASITTDVINADVADNSSSPALGCSSSVPCSICFDLVIDDGERSIAKLHCGHKFHLDCIGSAFNTKGTMQCPNCRKVENGRWLFADSSPHAISGARDWIPNELPHDLSNSRRPFGFHWCPFNGFTIHSSIEDADSTLHTSSYFRPNEYAGNSNFHHPLNSIFAPQNNVRSANIQQLSWGWNCHFLPYNAERDYRDTLRPTRTQADAVARSPSFFHPLHYTQQRFGGARSLPMLLPPVTSRPDHRGTRGFYIHEPESFHNYNTHEGGSFHHHFSSNRNHWS